MYWCTVNSVTASSEGERADGRHADGTGGAVEGVDPVARSRFEDGGAKQAVPLLHGIRASGGDRAVVYDGDRRSGTIPPLAKSPSISG